MKKTCMTLYFQRKNLYDTLFSTCFLRFYNTELRKLENKTYFDAVVFVNESKGSTYVLRVWKLEPNIFFDVVDESRRLNWIHRVCQLEM